VSSPAKSRAAKDPDPDLTTGDSETTPPSRRDIEAHATALRVAGASPAEIANSLDLATPRIAAKTAERGLARALAGTAAENRALDVTRADIAIAALWPKVEGGDPAAASALAALLDVRSRLLGLVEPPVTARSQRSPAQRRTKSNANETPNAVENSGSPTLQLELDE
jgi:hypothetical protein